jgi:hypothetical protein
MGYPTRARALANQTPLHSENPHVVLWVIVPYSGCMKQSSEHAFVLRLLNLITLCCPGIS